MKYLVMALLALTSLAACQNSADGKNRGYTIDIRTDQHPNHHSERGFCTPEQAKNGHCREMQ